MKNTKPTLLKHEQGVGWIDVANLALFALNEPMPSSSVSAFVTKWRAYDDAQKLTEARRLMTPHFLCDDLVTTTRVVPLKRAGDLLNEHAHGSLKGHCVGVNVGTEEKPKLIATAFAAEGVSQWLQFLNEHRASKRRDKNAECRTLVAKLAPLCIARRTDFKAQKLIARLDYLVELHTLTECLVRSQQLAITAPSVQET